jgi:hypothetical protein
MALGSSRAFAMVAALAGAQRSKHSIFLLLCLNCLGSAHLQDSKSTAAAVTGQQQHPS